MLFEAALRKTHEEIYEAEDEGAPERGEDFRAMVTQLAVNCFHSGIPEEETVKRTIFHYYLRRQEVLIRQLIKNVYEEQKGFGKKSSLGKEQYLSLQTEEFMNRRYEFRYNTQVGEVEYRERNSFHFYFNPINKRVLNSIALDAQVRRDSAMGQGHKPIHLLQPHPRIQSVGRFPLPSSHLGRQRPYPQTGANRSLRKQALGRLVSPLVSQHGHALAWDR